MKKIFFYANFRTYDNTVGITQKVKSQIKAFESLGYDVTYTGYLKDGVAIFNGGEIIKCVKYPFKNERLNHLMRRFILLKVSKNFLLQSTVTFDFAYLRYHFFDAFYISLLKAIKSKGIKSVIEMHSYPTFTPHDKFNPFKYFDMYYSKQVKRYCSLIVAMTNLKNILNIKTVEIENSLTPSKYTIKHTQKLENDFTLINVAFENITHGLDRVIVGISEYLKSGGDKKIKLLLIGSYSSKTKKLVSDLSLNDSVIFLGQKEKNEMDAYFDTAHMAIGSIGNHRANSYYGSALKTKEYIARGIPFVYGWNERVLHDFPYAIKVPLSEEPINIFEMLGFYEKIYTNDLAKKIHNELAVKNITWSIQFKKIISILNEV